MNIPHWLRFYRKPLTHLGCIALFLYLVGNGIGELLAKGPELWTIMFFGFNVPGIIFLGINASGAVIYAFALYKWRKQFIQWKFQSFQRGGFHSGQDYDDSKYRERFEK